MPNEIPLSKLSLNQKLAKLQVLELDAEIFSMFRAEFRQHFSFPPTNPDKKPGLNTKRLMKSLIWQDLSYILAGTLEKFRGNIRSYWYARVKPVLTRAKKATKHYDAMTDQLVAKRLASAIADRPILGPDFVFFNVIFPDSQLITSPQLR